MRLALLAIACLATATAAQARPLQDLCSQFEPLRKIADLGYIRPKILVEPKAPAKPQDVVFTIDARAGVIKVVPDAEGKIELPLTDKLCAENPNVDVNQPPGTLGLGISIDPAIPPVRTIGYKDLQELRRQWDEAISRQNLAWRLLAPGSKAFQVSFEPGKGGSAEVRLAAGIRKLVADEKGQLRIPFEDSWISANPVLVFSDVPKRIGLAFK